MELLAVIKNNNVYFNLEDYWMDYELYVEDEKGKPFEFTMDSGEYENNFGEFIVLKDKIPSNLEEKVDLVINELAKENSIRDIPNSSWIKFKMKEKYLDRIIIAE